MRDEKLYKCACGQFSFLEVWFDQDFYYFMITEYPRGFIQKLKAIWHVIRGSKYEVSTDIVMRIEDAEDLSNFIEHFKKYGKNK